MSSNLIYAAMEGAVQTLCQGWRQPTSPYSTHLLGPRAPPVPIVPGGLINAALQGTVLALCKVGSLCHHIGALLQGSHQAHDQLQDAAQHLADAEVQRDGSSGPTVPIRLQQSGLQKQSPWLQQTRPQYLCFFDGAGCRAADHPGACPASAGMPTCEQQVVVLLFLSTDHGCFVQCPICCCIAARHGCQLPGCASTTAGPGCADSELLARWALSQVMARATCRSGHCCPTAQMLRLAEPAAGLIHMASGRHKKVLLYKTASNLAVLLT